MSTTHPTPGHRCLHTGKVQIGLLYQPTTRPHHDRDATLLQSALLSRRSAGTLERLAVRLVRRAWRWA
jgi:hypothetical protein